jgi:hypothetical protein
MSGGAEERRGCMAYARCGLLPTPAWKGRAGLGEPQAARSLGF